MLLLLHLLTATFLVPQSETVLVPACENALRKEQVDIEIKTASVEISTSNEGFLSLKEDNLIL